MVPFGSESFRGISIRSKGTKCRIRTTRNRQYQDPNAMTFLSETSAGISWLNRFSEHERETAGQLIDQILLVGRDDFANGLRGLLDDIAGQRGQPPGNMALYAERPVK